MIKKLLLGSLLLTGSLYAGTINIAVAANVSYAIDELKAEFNKLNPDTKINVTLGSSGKLTAQIRNGAPYQLFMAANMKFPESLYADGVAVTRPLIYAQGSLAYFGNKEYDFSKGIKLIQDKKINKIAVANPKTAPYGKAAIEAITNAGIYDSVESKFVYAESISQTVSYAVTAADIGFIAKSSLYSATMKKYQEGVNWADVDPKLYTPINQGIVIVKNGEANNEVAAFYAFMLSPKAKKILNDYGYLVP